MMPTLIGMSITTENRFEIFDLLEDHQGGIPAEKLLIVGGPHATMAGLDMVANIPAIDLAVIGEGERTILEIAAWQEAGG